MGKKPRKLRIDHLLHDRGLTESRERARALVMAGRVRIDGRVVDKPGATVAADANVTVEAGQRFVSRGGVKLDHALSALGIDPAGFVALDVGASTGGFTDCLLQRGAARVYAVDVGRGQLAYSLRQDPRVVVMEKVNAHHPFELPERVRLTVADVSFISLRSVLPNVLAHVEPGGEILCLVKPQFEAGRDRVGRGGVVRDPLVHAAVLGEIGLWAIGRGLRVLGIIPSPILGDRGNREFFIRLQVPSNETIYSPLA